MLNLGGVSTVDPFKKLVAKDEIPDPDTWGGNRNKSKGSGKGKGGKELLVLHLASFYSGKGWIMKDSASNWDRGFFIPIFLVLADEGFSIRTFSFIVFFEKKIKMPWWSHHFSTKRTKEAFRPKMVRQRPGCFWMLPCSTPIFFPWSHASYDPDGWVPTRVPVAVVQSVLFGDLTWLFGSCHGRSRIQRSFRADPQIFAEKSTAVKKHVGQAPSTRAHLPRIVK